MSNIESKNLGQQHIPQQKVGSEINASASADLVTEEQAILFYKTVRQRLFHVNKWSEYAKLPLSSFKLFDNACRVADRAALEGDFIRIDIPGPGTKTGQGYDWVVIEAISEENEQNTSVVSMTVRPSPHPLSGDPHTAHFLKDTASSTFQIKRSKNMVIAEQHGRNEIPNRDTAHTLDNLRNTVVGWSSKLGFSYPQWKGLVKGLVQNP